MVNPRRWTPLRWLTVLVFLATFSLGLIGQVSAQEQGGHALVAQVDGIINPVSQRHIAKSIERGEEEGAEVVIILLDTPGGLLSSTRKIVQGLLEAKVPTVVYVSPRGAQAASAGTFITAAAHFAVMAPGTNIGAATPVGGGGEDLPDTLESKATNDAAALMRAIAAERGRDADKLEATVRKALSYSANEAVEGNVVDFIASDLDDLLAQLDGQVVQIGGRTVTLKTGDIPVQKLEMSLVDKFLFILADPNISFLLFSIGGLAVVIEVIHPGLIFPGVTGVILLVLAFVSFGNLPVNWAGAALIILAGALIVAEFYVSGFGVLGIGGIVAFILGSMLLFSHFGTPSPTAPSIRVSLWVLVPFAVIVLGGGGWVMWSILSSRKGKAQAELSPQIGQVGEVVEELSPRGLIRLQTELWTAVSEGRSTISPGQYVRVVSQEGAMLTVRPEVAAESGVVTQ